MDCQRKTDDRTNFKDTTLRNESITLRCDFNHTPEDKPKSDSSLEFVGEKVGAVMEKSDVRPVPVCLLAHEMINRLSVIIGNCDLMNQKAKVDAECAKRLSAIRESAHCMVVELSRHQCELNGLLRTTVIENGKFLT